MIRVAADRLKTEIDSLLVKAEAGDEIIIERDGKPVARLVADRVPLTRNATEDPVAALVELRKTTRLDGLTWQELKNEGRR